MPDTKGDMLTTVAPEGKILYFMTYADFTNASTINTTFSHGAATLYINGLQVFSSGQTGTSQVTMSFSKGWNIIEIVSNNAPVCFGINISEH